MHNLFTVYNDFYNTGDLQKFDEGLADVGSSNFLSSIEKYDLDFISNVKLVVAYMEMYGFDVKDDKGNPVYQSIMHKPPYFRLTISEKMINAISNDVWNNRSVIKSTSGYPHFNGELFFKNIDGKSDDYIKSIFDVAASVFVFGFPVSDYKYIQQLKVNYILSGTIMQSVMYNNMTDAWMKEMLTDLTAWNLTVADWCTTFDGIWFNIENQIQDGFVSIFNPNKPEKITCSSVLYQGEYFITNMLVFKELYERDFLGTIRFVDRKVNTGKLSSGKWNGETSEKILRVPVFYDDGEEVLVSELNNSNYIYDDIFTRDISRMG